MNELSFRDASAGDARTIIDFQLAMAQETEELELDRDTCTSGVQAVFADPALGRYFVATRDGRVVASLMITFEWSDWRNGMVWWIQSVYVTPALRGQRVYAGLYEYIRALTDGDPKIRGIRLYVDRRNIVAQQVYARLGMNGEHYQVFEWMKE